MSIGLGLGLGLVGLELITTYRENSGAICIIICIIVNTPPQKKIIFSPLMGGQTLIQIYAPLWRRSGPTINA